MNFLGCLSDLTGILNETSMCCNGLLDPTYTIVIQTDSARNLILIKTQRRKCLARGMAENSLSLSTGSYSIKVV